MKVTPISRRITVRMGTGISFEVEACGARALRAFPTDATTAPTLLLELPADVPRLRLDGVGYVSTGPIDARQHEALLRLLTPGRTVALVDMDKD